MGSEARANPGSSEFVGPATETYDARKRVLQEGDEIILAVPGPLFFRVAKITPVLDPSAPPGMLFVHVGCMLTFTAKRGAVNREFVRVRSVQEAGPAEFVLLDAQPKEAGGGGTGGES